MGSSDNQISQIRRMDNSSMEDWIVNFRSDLDKHELPDETTSLMHARRTNTTEETEKVSIFWHDKPTVAHIGFLLYGELFLPDICNETRKLRHKSILVSHERIKTIIDMKKYAAFMTRWLGLNLDLHLKCIEERESNVRQYYSGFLNRCLIKNSQCFLETLTCISCFLAFAILSFQNVLPNGIKILRGSRDRKSDPEYDQRFTHFSILYQEIMQQQIQIKLDMLNLANQIPWFAVEAVFTNSTLSNLVGNGIPIHRLAFKCFDDLYPSVNKSKVNGGTSTIPSGGFKHLLHIFHWTRTPEGKYLVGSRPAQSLKTLDSFHIPSATDLLASETVFKKIDDGSIDVRYSDKIINGEMHLSPLLLFDYSLELFGSLLDFEQWYLDCGLPVTAYVGCMARLLQTEEDVKLLQQKGIVRTSTMTGEQKTLRNIKYIGSVLPVMSYIPDEISVMSEKVRKHHDSRVSRLWAEIKRHYCPNKWVFISVIAAICLFILTIIQTLYGTLDYYKPGTF